MKINQKLFNCYEKIKNYYWKVISLDILVLILYEFKDMRKICKKVIVALFGQELSKELSNNISNIGIQIGRCLFLTLFIVGMVIVVMRIAMKVWNYRKYKERLEKLIEKEGNLARQLDKYIKDKHDKCFLVTGEWGIGKTFKVNNFISEYKKCHNNHIYNISCFGVSSREELIKQIKKECEKQDYNYKTRILDMIKYIPIFGDALYKLFKSDYELSDLKQDSIFVFDDFERIAPSISLRRSSNYYPERQRQSIGNEYYNEFRKIGDAIAQIDTEQIINIEYEKMFRYDIVSGLIDELVQKYKMKVIVICSLSIGNCYLNEMFINKLGAVRYNVVGEQINLKTILEKDLKNCYSIDEFKMKKLQKFIDENYDDIDRVWKDNNRKNLRNLSSIFMDFIYIIEQLNDEEVKKYYCYWRCIFYSIVYIKIKGRRRYIRELAEDKIGENLCITKYSINKGYSIEEIFKNVKNKKDIMWMGEKFCEKYLRNDNIEKKFLIEVFDKLDRYENKTIENIIVMKGKVGRVKINNVIDSDDILLLLLECDNNVIGEFFEKNKELEITFHYNNILEFLNGVFSNQLISDIVLEKIGENETAKNILFRNIFKAENNHENVDDSMDDLDNKDDEQLTKEYNNWKKSNHLN